MMAFTSEFLDDVRSRVSLAEVVGRRVRLIKRGREHVALCPFHDEKSPSFTVSADKGFYHCFGCAAHGSVFDFVMQTQGLTFVEAVERLAEEAGMTVPPRSAVSPARTERQARLYDIVEYAAAWFEAQLQEQAGAGARDYLAARGLAAATLRQFRLGFAPDARNVLKAALTARGFDEAVAIETGLLVKPEDGGESYDFLRNRVVFPITDGRGRVIAFGGRTLGLAKAKYLNSRESPLFRKGRTLYNLAGARQAIREAGTVLLAEGYVDVIALAQAGFGHAVAPLGTALTEDQMRALWAAAAEPILCFDGDAAGRRAALSAAERALPMLKPGCSLRVVLLASGDDPDSLIRREGAEAMRRALASAVPLAEILWQGAVAGRSLDTPERRAALEKALLALVGRIDDQTVRSYYRNFVKQRLREAFAGGHRAFKGRAAAGRRTLGSGHVHAGYRRERLLVVTLLNHPLLLERVAEPFCAAEFADSELDALRSALIEIVGSVTDLDSTALRQHLCERGFAAILERIAGPGARVLDWFALPDAEIEDAEMGWRHALARHHRADLLQRELKAAEAVLAEDMSQETYARFLALKGDMERAEGNEAELANFGVASGHRSAG